MIALGSYLKKPSDGRFRYDLWAFILIAVGVATMFGFSFFGGFGGNTGISGWWALTLLPYPAGWLMVIARIFGRIIEYFRKKPCCEQVTEPPEKAE